MASQETNMTSVILSKEQQNFTCLVFVCLDFIKLPLKDILAKEIAPKDLYDRIQRSALMTKLREVQKRICFVPQPNEPDYSKFDVTLSYTLIRNLGSSSLRPSRGWGIEPKEWETQIGDDIERIHFLRNRIAHANSALICDNEFNCMWQRLRLVIQRMQTFVNCSTKYEDQLSIIKKRTFCLGVMKSYIDELKLHMAFSGESDEIGNLKRRY